MDVGGCRCDELRSAAGTGRLVGYPSVTDPADKVTLLVEHHTSMYVMHLFSFELVALALIVVTLAIYQHLYEHAPATSQVATAVGLIRVGLLLASVLVFNHGMAVVVDQQASNPQQATATWQVIEPVADALGGAGGDVLGGVWFLLVSWVALRSMTFPRVLNWLGLGVGAALLFGRQVDSGKIRPGQASGHLQVPNAIRGERSRGAPPGSG